MWKTSPERRHIAGGDLFDLGQHPHGDAYPDRDGKGGLQQLGFEYTCIASYPFKETGVMSRFISFHISKRHRHVKLTERRCVHPQKMFPRRCSSNIIGERTNLDYIFLFLVSFRHPANRIHRMLAGRLAARCPAQLSASPVKVTRGNTFLAGTR